MVNVVAKENIEQFKGISESKELRRKLICTAEWLVCQLLNLYICFQVITMSHQMELYDEEPFNFEMILNRYLKFAKNSMSVKLIERPVILKAFERIQVSSDVVYHLTFALTFFT